MLVAILLASIAVDPPKNAPILAADPRFDFILGRKCFVLARDGGNLYVPANREWIEPLQKAINAHDRVRLDKMLELGTAFRVSSGTPVMLLEKGPIVEADQRMSDRETAIVLPNTTGKHLLYWKVRFVVDPLGDRVAVVAPENLGWLAKFKALSPSQVRITNTPTHSAVAVFCRAARVENVSATADALDLYQEVLDKYPTSDVAVLAQERIRAIRKQR